MVFRTLEFVVFLVLILGLFYSLPKKARPSIVLVASMLFLAYFSVHFLVYTLIYALINYVIALVVEDSKNKKFKKTLHVSGITLNVVLLASFKYFEWLVENIYGLLKTAHVTNESVFYRGISNVFDGLFTLLRSFGEHSSSNLDKIIVPLGISFFTFQCIGYLLDVYRGVQKAERNPIAFVNFVIYFPKLISGPVERTKNLMPQMGFNKDFDFSLFIQGLRQMLWGFFKKLIIADRLSALILGVYGGLENYQGWALIVTFSLQMFYLYADFSGYTDIVLGISKLFGVRLIDNFQRPFFAENVSNYWRRWHISLSTWCNDYIFKKVVLKRMKWKKWGAIYAAFLTFSVLGFWHGASWNYIILGLAQALAISYEYLSKKQRLKVGKKLPANVNLYLSRFITLLFMSLSHVFFFSSKFSDIIYFLGNMFTNLGKGLYEYEIKITPGDFIIILSAGFVVLLVDFYNEKGIAFVNRLWKKQWFRWALYLFAGLAIYAFGKLMENTFIYENF